MTEDDDETGGGPEAAKKLADQAKDDSIQEDSPGVEPDTSESDAD